MSILNRFCYYHFLVTFLSAIETVRCSMGLEETILDDLERIDTIINFKRRIANEIDRLPAGSYDLNGNAQSLIRFLLLSDAHGLVERQHGRRVPKQRWTVEEIPQKVTSHIFDDNKLGKLRQRFNSIYEMVLTSFKPELDAILKESYKIDGPVFQPWYMNQCPNATWQGKTGRQNAQAATLELISILQKENGWGGMEDIIKYLRKIHFRRGVLPFKASLTGMLGQRYKRHWYEAVIDAYPTLHLKQWYFDVGRNFWEQDERNGYPNAKEATNQLLDNLMATYRWSPSELAKKINRRYFRSNVLPYNVSLAGMQQQLFPDFRDAVVLARPDLYKKENGSLVYTARAS